MSILKKLTTLALVAVMVVVMAGANVGCYTQKFEVGTGTAGGERREFQQWFALWGLVPITQIDDDVASYTADATNYTITTQFTPIDVLIGIFTGIVTIQPKTVTIEK